MPQSPERSRPSRRDDRASRHTDDPRQRRSQRSLSPRALSTRGLREGDRERARESARDNDRDRDSRRHRSPHRERAKKAHAAAGHEGAALPFGARPLRKGDFAAFEPLFVEYLELQKQRDVKGMDEREVRGRWKSFVGKWNRGELAEGWYDPEVFQRAASRAEEGWDAEDAEERGQGREAIPERRAAERVGSPAARRYDTGDEEEDEDDEGEDEDEEGQEGQEGQDSGGDDYGPVLPGAERGRRSGAAIPSVQDLALRDEMVQESREAGREELREARKADRRLQKERLDELAPRAEAGTRERKLEKRRETNDKMRQFREKSPGAAEVGEKELMGGGDSLEEYRKDKERDRKRKSEREARREELARARREEIEEKRRAWQEREDKTVSMLRELAKQRFG